MAGRRKSVTLGDTTVTEEDVGLLERPNWLNDQLISLWCEHVRPKDNDKILLLPPNITYFLKLCDDPSDVVGALNLKDKEVIVAAVNNTDSDGGSFTRPLGTHWSVLAYSRQTQTFISLDSWDGMDTASAQLAKKLSPVLGLNKIVVKSARSAKQPNSYACGDYACAFIAKIAEDFANHQMWPSHEVSYDTTAVHARANTMRGELSALVELLVAGRQ